MCTYLNHHIDIKSSGKGQAAWFKLTEANVYVDHPVHAMQDHTLNIDLLNPAKGPDARLALEMSEQDARALAQAILDALAAAPAGLAAAS